jgi:hypothetical protein
MGIAARVAFGVDADRRSPEYSDVTMLTGAHGQRLTTNSRGTAVTDVIAERKPDRP